MTDRANCGEITIQHCPTAEMVGDFFTKPLQGGLFTKFRDRILNIQTDPPTVPIEDHRSVLGREHSHATGQSHGESQATEQHKQSDATEMPDKRTAQARDKPYNNPNDQAVMVPMSQPIGGWHVTSMTGRSRPTLAHHMTHDYTDQT